MWWFFLMFFICVIFLILIDFLKNRRNKNSDYTSLSIKRNFNSNIYIKKVFMSDLERYFYLILKELELEYHIKVHPQINLASIIDKVNHRKYYNELFRNIDFAIFSEDYSTLLLLIEVNDCSHRHKDRYIRDQKVRSIVNAAGIHFIAFSTRYSNKKYYVQNRVLNEIGIKK